MKTETVSVPVAVALAFFVAGGFLYLGIWMWRSPEYFVSQYASFFESVLGEKRFGKERDRWLRGLRTFFRRQAVLSMCVGIFLLFFLLWGLVRYLMGS